MLRHLILGQLRDEEQTEASRELALIVWIWLAAFHLLLLSLIVLPQYSTRWWRLLAGIYAVCIPTLILNHRGHTRFASLFLIVGLWLVLTGAALTAGGIESFAPLYYVAIVFIAGSFLGSRTAIVTALICILTALGLVVIEMTGHMPSTPLQRTPLSRWISTTLFFVIMIALQYLSVRRVHDALGRSRQELEERRRAEVELRRISERLQLATRAASIGIWDWDVINDELVWDDAMYRLYGVRREDFSGAFDAWKESLVPEDFDRANDEVQAALRGGREFGGEFRIVWPDGSVHFTKAASQTFRDEAGRALRMVGVNYDITERKQAEERIALLQMIMIDIAAAPDLPAALEVVLRRVCETTGWAMGQAWVPRQDGTGLDCCPAWFATAASLEEFRAFSRATTILPGTGLPGRVWASRQPAWIRDVTQDKNFPRAEVARKGGLKAALGVPILSGDEVIAVLEFFLSEPREEDERLVKVIAAVGAQIGLVIERKRAEEKLRWSEERLRLLLDSTAEGIFGVDLEGRCTFCNAACLRLLGYDLPSELLGQGMHTLIAHSRADGTPYPKEDCPVVASLQDSTSVFVEDDVFWRKDGVSFRAEYRSYPILQEDKHIGAVVTFLDITERKLAEEALRESERRFSDTLTNIEMIAVMADMNGDLTFCNDYLFRLTGWTREEAIGRNWFETFLPEDEKQKVSKILNEVEPAGEVTIHLENAIKTRSGERRLVKWTNTTLRGMDGEVIGVAALGDDITERKQAEEQLKAFSDQLRALSERLRKAKEEEGIRIARELHDELGSALTSLKWSLLGLDKVYSGDQSSEVHSSAQIKIGEMVALVDATVNTVRRISSELRPGVLDDLGLVPAIEWHAQQFQEQTGIVCRFDFPVDNPELDREQATTIFRIFQEAMTNILRHSQATKVNLLIEDEEGEFVLEITDNGRGITESEKLGIRSLGLLGMRERANSIGARIDINGTTGKGTKLIVRLALNPEAAA